MSRSSDTPKDSKPTSETTSQPAMRSYFDLLEEKYADAETPQPAYQKQRESRSQDASTPAASSSPEESAERQATSAAESRSDSQHTHSSDPAPKRTHAPRLQSIGLMLGVGIVGLLLLWGLQPEPPSPTVNSTETEGSTPADLVQQSPKSFEELGTPAPDPDQNSNQDRGSESGQDETGDLDSSSPELGTLEPTSDPRDGENSDFAAPAPSPSPTSSTVASSPVSSSIAASEPLLPADAQQDPDGESLNGDAPTSADAQISDEVQNPRPADPATSLSSIVEKFQSLGRQSTTSDSAEDSSDSPDRNPAAPATIANSSTSQPSTDAEAAGNGLAPYEPAQKIFSPQPPYPPAARDRGETGTVVVKGRITPDGDVRDARIVTSVSEDLDRAALGAFRTWQFQPALRNKVPVDSEYSVAFRFAFDGATEAETRVAPTDIADIEGGPGSPPAGDGSNELPLPWQGSFVPPGRYYSPLPTYPQSAWATGTQGNVTLEVVVRTDGRVGAVRVIDGLPDGISEAAVEAVKRWQFRPATRDGEVVAVYHRLTLRFAP